jgi:large subunit ribosomal protein L21
MGYAIIELGGKQHRVEKGDSVVVDRLNEKEGAKLAMRALLYRSDETVFEGAEPDKVKVEAVVAEHLKGDKVRVFKYRPKKRYRRSAGHRSLLTRLEINEIRGPVAAKAATGSAEGRKPADGSASRKAATGSGEASGKPATGSAEGRKAEAAKKKGTSGRRQTGKAPSKPAAKRAQGAKKR